MKSFLKTSSNGQYNLAKELTQWYFLYSLSLCPKVLRGGVREKWKGTQHRFRTNWNRAEFCLKIFHSAVYVCISGVCILGVCKSVVCISEVCFSVVCISGVWILENYSSGL